MLFTGHGDAGYTSVIGGPALPKCDVRLEALGALDEAQAHLGLARALLTGTPWAESLKHLEADLQLLMADCATISQCGQHLSTEHVSHLESDLAAWDGNFHGLTIPGDTLIGAHLHLARTAIRRAERRVVALFQAEGIENPVMLAYLNRLSSWVYGLIMITEGAANVPSVAVA